MKLSVIGSRTFENYEMLANEILKLNLKISSVISGGAKGADTLAEKWARENNIPILLFKPDWKKYGRAAGLRRNESIIESCDYCLAFWDGKSKGTKFSIDLCKKLKKPIKLVNFV